MGVRRFWLLAWDEGPEERSGHIEKARLGIFVNSQCWCGKRRFVAREQEPIFVGMLGISLDPRASFRGFAKSEECVRSL